ncbi:orotidine 5'-phosphate decarboxylase / HUMPS family protein [Arcanobacterium ihumii]|uniref:orotidine 5'-phosphate decarboxylase / HUMPS family protein n=1 Tax=Arcanobacterium ihumii TaxID=2138162 RepID=UPI000F529A8E|nr:orotidine 5'-phosphate decarboxylase / HUMPS family protein [Arcanobacterium ihumii]
MTPRLQIALDTRTLEDALSALSRGGSDAEVIECGTILILNEGLRAVRAIRAAYPDKTILADVRIAEAGSIIARDCFAAGANWVSCVAGASLTTIRQVVEVARECDAEVQVELSAEHFSLDRAKEWRAIGVEHVIVKRSRDLEAAGTLTWGEKEFEQIDALHELGFTVSVTGGIKVDELDTFAGKPVGVVIAGRTIVGAEDPRSATAQMHEAMRRIWP